MGHQVQPSCRSRVTYSRLHRTASRRVLNISREGDSTTSLGSLFQCSITLRVKKFFLTFSWSFLCFSLCLLPLVLSWLVAVFNCEAHRCLQTRGPSPTAPRNPYPQAGAQAPPTPEAGAGPDPAQSRSGQGPASHTATGAGGTRAPVVFTDGRDKSAELGFGERFPAGTERHGPGAELPEPARCFGRLRDGAGSPPYRGIFHKSH